MSKTIETALNEAKIGLDVTCAELQQAHSLACHDDADQFAEMVLLDLLTEARELKSKISRAQQAAKIGGK